MAWRNGRGSAVEEGEAAGERRSFYKEARHPSGMMRTPKISRRRLILTALSAAAAASIAGFTARGALHNTSPELTTLDQGLGRRFALIADLHIHRPGEDHAERALRALEGTGSEYIILGGDMVDEETEGPSALDWFLRELNTERGYAVLGNHDYWSGRDEETVGILRRRGVEVLRDEAVPTPFGRLLGIDWRESRSYGVWRSDGLVAVHDPNAADHVRGGATILSGHTHGGLILFGRTIYSNSRYVRGLYRLSEGRVLYVSRGVGQMLHQPRLNSPPEILLLE